MGVSPSSVASCSIFGLTFANSSSSSCSMLGASVKNFVVDSQKSSSTPDILWISGCQELHCVATQPKIIGLDSIPTAVRYRIEDREELESST